MRIVPGPPQHGLAALVAVMLASCTVDVPELRTGDDSVDASDAGDLDAHDAADAKAEAEDVGETADAPEDADAGDADASECPPGLGDCDETPGTCETTLSSDSAHCGACRHDCLGGQCVDGKCRPVALTIPGTHPYQLVLSSTDGTGDLYWTCEACEDFGVWKSTSAFTAATGFAAVGLPGAQEFTTGIAISPFEVFWAESLTGEVRRIAKSGGTPWPMTTGSVPGTQEVATDGNHVYFSGTNGKVSRVSVNVAGAPTEDLVTGLGSPRSVVLGSDRVYWGDSKAKKISRANKDGSGACDIAATNYAPRSIAFESPWVYWREGTDVDTEGRVMKARDECPSLEIVELATGQGGPRYLALYDDYVYYVILSGSIRRVPKAGGASEELYMCSEQAHGIAVDDKAIYWTSWGAGKVYRLAHPL